RPANQPLEFLGAAIDPPGARLPGVSRLGRSRQHRVLRRDPAFPGALLVRRRLIVPAGGAEHACVAHVDDGRALGIEVHVSLDLYGADLVRFTAVGSCLSQRDYLRRARITRILASNRMINGRVSSVGVSGSMPGVT